MVTWSHPTQFPSRKALCAWWLVCESDTYLLSVLFSGSSLKNNSPNLGEYDMYQKRKLKFTDKSHNPEMTFRCASFQIIYVIIYLSIFLIKMVSSSTGKLVAAVGSYTDHGSVLVLCDRWWTKGHTWGSHEPKTVFKIRISKNFKDSLFFP